MAAKTTKKSTTRNTAPKKINKVPAPMKAESASKVPARVSKTPARRTAVKSERVERKTTIEHKAPAVRSTSRSESLSAALPQMKVKKSTVLIGLAVVLVLVLLYAFRGLFVVATVNGQPISRLGVIKELEQAYGKQQLNTDISKTLIQQEANRRDISVSQSDVNADVKKVEAQLAQQGQKLDTVLQQQGMTRNQWLEGEKIRITLQKMFAKEITVTDKDIDAYITQNKTSLPEDAATNKQVRTSIKDRLQSDKLSQKIQTWLQQQQSKAKINYLVNY